MNTKQHYTYKITNLNPTDETLYYIGVRTAKNCLPEEDTLYMSSSKYLKADIAEFGVENFKKEVLSTWDTREEAVLEEIRLHNLFNVVLDDSYYNKSKQTSTGFDTSDRIFSDEERLERSINMKQVFKDQPEILEAKSKAMKGEGNHFYGKKHSEEALKKISESSKGRIPNEETRKKLSKVNAGANNNRALTIKIYDNNDNLQYEFSGSFWSEAKELGLPRDAFVDSYRKSKKLYQTPQGLGKAKQRGFEKFVGWYAVKS